MTNLIFKILIILIVGGLAYKTLSIIERCVFEIEYEKAMDRKLIDEVK